MKGERKILKSLIIDDSENDVLLLVDQLKRDNYQVAYQQVDNSLTLQDALTQNWDIIFCDFSMPCMDGLEALRIVRKNDSQVPFIFVSGTIGEERAADAKRNGAQDYVRKTELKRLRPIVKRILSEGSNRVMRQQSAKQFHYNSGPKNLTKLSDRAGFLKILSQYISDMAGAIDPVAVVYIDLDRFRRNNESLGYEVGIEALRLVARRLRSCVPGGAAVARILGDEFAVILGSVNKRREIEKDMDNIRIALSQPIEVAACKLHMHASIGVAFFPLDAVDATRLLRCAEIAAHHAKLKGGYQHSLYSEEMTAHIEERHALDLAMREGLLHNKFKLHYQPQWHLDSGNIEGIEVLIRLASSPARLVAPDRFIPLAEETGFILPLGAWIIDCVCAQAKKWQSQGLSPLRVYINISARQFQEGNIVEKIMASLAKYDLGSEWLGIEVTETAIINDPQRILINFQDLRREGIKVSLDDFGTGYSSLSHLKDFKVDSIKIDKSFIEGIPNDVGAKAITSAVITMAKKLNISVIAEGVESQDQIDFLRQEGCDLVQGYFLGRPLSSKKILQLLQSNPGGKP